MRYMSLEMKEIKFPSRMLVSIKHFLKRGGSYLFVHSFVIFCRQKCYLDQRVAFCVILSDKYMTVFSYFFYGTHIRTCQGIKTVQERVTSGLSRPYFNIKSFFRCFYTVFPLSLQLFLGGAGGGRQEPRHFSHPRACICLSVCVCVRTGAERIQNDMPWNDIRLVCLSIRHRNVLQKRLMNHLALYRT